MSNLDGVYTCMFYGRVSHLVEFYFQRNRMEKRRVDYARNSSQNEFTDFLPRISSRTPSHALPHTSSCALSHFSH
jgi:hypothetical protein